MRNSFTHTTKTPRRDCKRPACNLYRTRAAIRASRRFVIIARGFRGPYALYKLRANLACVFAGLSSGGAERRRNLDGGGGANRYSPGRARRYPTSSTRNGLRRQACSRTGTGPIAYAGHALALFANANQRPADRFRISARHAVLTPTQGGSAAGSTRPPGAGSGDEDGVAWKTRVPVLTNGRGRLFRRRIARVSPGLVRFARRVAARGKLAARSRCRLCRRRLSAVIGNPSSSGADHPERAGARLGSV